jgi:hypothetical protein
MIKTLLLSGAAGLAFVLAGIYVMSRTPPEPSTAQEPAPAPTAEPKLETATFGGGCFW